MSRGHAVDRFREAGPAAARVELVRGEEERLAGCHVHVETPCRGGGVRAREGRLGGAFPGDREGNGGEPLPQQGAVGALPPGTGAPLACSPFAGRGLVKPMAPCRFVRDLHAFLRAAVFRMEKFLSAVAGVRVNPSTTDVLSARAGIVPLPLPRQGAGRAVRPVPAGRSCRAAMSRCHGPSLRPHAGGSAPSCPPEEMAAVPPKACR